MQAGKPSFLFVSTMNSSAWGGSEEAWYTAALELAAKGHDIGCAFYDWPAKQAKILRLQQQGCKVYLLPNKGITKKNIGERCYYAFITKPAQRRSLFRLPVTLYDQVIISQGGYKDVCDLIYTGWSKKPAAYTLLYHNYNKDYHFRRGKADRLRYWMKNATANIFAAEAARRVIEKQLSYTIPNALTLINPITFNKPSLPVAYPGLINNNYVFVMLAAFDMARKGQDRLVEVLSSGKWKQRNWELHLYGSGKDQQWLEQLIVHNGIQDRIFIKGFTKDVRRVLSNAHLLLQLTLLDAMPLSVVEAMAVGRPAVVTEVGDMCAWIKEGLTGFISPDTVSASIDATLERAWNKKMEWEEMGRKAFAFFSERYPEDYGGYFLALVTSLYKNK